MNRCRAGLSVGELATVAKRRPTFCLRRRLRSRAAAAKPGRMPRPDPHEAALEAHLLLPDPESMVKRPVGCSHRHGKKFDLKDSKTWTEPSAKYLCENENYDTVRVRTWAGLHPKTCRAKERYAGRTAAVGVGIVVLWKPSGCPEARDDASSRSSGFGRIEGASRTSWKSYCCRFHVEHGVNKTLLS